MEDKLLKIIEKRSSTQNVSKELKKIKDMGITQKEVYNWLENYRNNKISEELDDWILEIMDIVVGYCKKDFRVWN